MANRYFPFLLQDLAFLKPHYSFANFRLGKVWEWKMSEAWVTKTKNKHFKISWLEKDCVSLLTDIYVFLTLCTFQFFVTNAFLNYQFISYGFEVYQHYRWGKMSLKQRKITVKIFFYCRLPPEERQLPDAINPMCEVFPKGQWYLSKI